MEGSSASQRSTPVSRPTAKRLTLAHRAEPVVTFIPAPLLVVRRRAGDSDMGVFASRSRRLADEVAKRWGGEVVVLSIDRCALPHVDARDTMGTPQGHAGSALSDVGGSQGHRISGDRPRWHHSRCCDVDAQSHNRDDGAPGTPASTPMAQPCWSPRLSTQPPRAGSWERPSPALGSQAITPLPLRVSADVAVGASKGWGE